MLYIGTFKKLLNCLSFFPKDLYKVVMPKPPPKDVVLMAYRLGRSKRTSRTLWPLAVLGLRASHCILWRVMWAWCLTDFYPQSCLSLVKTRRAWHVSLREYGGEGGWLPGLLVEMKWHKCNSVGERSGREFMCMKYVGGRYKTISEGKIAACLYFSQLILLVADLFDFLLKVFELGGHRNFRI